MQMAPVSWSCTVRVSGNNHVVMLLLSLWEVLGVGSCFSEQTSFFRDLYHWLWTTGDGSRNCPAIIVLWKTAFKFALQLQGCKLRGQNWSHLLSPLHFFSVKCCSWLSICPTRKQSLMFNCRVCRNLSSSLVTLRGALPCTGRLLL